MTTAENINRVEERIQKACRTAGRKRDEITLMGVSKFVPVGMIEEAYNAGIRCFGESRVQEAEHKFESFRESRPDIALHMVGSLQRNKAKSAAHLFDCIQSIDREPLVSELIKHVQQRQRTLEILFELHTGEETKSGFADIDSLLRAADVLFNTEGGKGLKPCGLMTMAPYTTDTALIRASFRRLVSAQKELEKRFPLDEDLGNWKCLSMGMSNDFEIAVEEGATLLRIGSIIFKE